MTSLHSLFWNVEANQMQPTKQLIARAPFPGCDLSWLMAEMRLTLLYI